MAEQIPMSDAEQNFWLSTIENRKKLMESHHARWRKLQRRYELKGIEIAGLEDNEVVKISRLYPMVRKIVNGIALKYPKIFVTLEDEERVGLGLEDSLELAGNDGMKRMDMKPHVRQGLLDTIFCYRPWWKIELAADSVSGVISTRDIEGFTKFQRVDPTKIFVEPGTLPHDYKSSPNIIEEMDVPLAYLMESPRFKHAKSLLAAFEKDNKSTMFEETFGGEDKEAQPEVEKARQLQRLTTCYEIHDRMKGHRKFLILGGRQDGKTTGLVLENINHPFLEAEAKKAKNQKGEEKDIEYTRPSGAKFIIEGGLPYYTDSFDLSDKFYGEPLASYEEEVEKLTMESQSRRADNLQRLKRITLIDNAAKENNPQFPQDLKMSGDGSMLPVTVPQGRSIRDVVVGVDWGSPQPDQILLERDAKADEEHLINVDAPGGRTATESAISAGPAELNRASMQTVPQDAYAWGIGAMLDIQADPRYENKAWLDTLSRKGNVSPDGAVGEGWLRVKRQIHIIAESMTPLSEQKKRDTNLAFVDRFINNPLIDQRKLLLRAAESLDISDPEGLMRDDYNTDATRSAQFELINYAFIGQPIPDSVRGEDHQTHMQVQDPEAVQGMPEFRNLQPQLQQIAMQSLQAHLQTHQQRIDEESAGTGGPVAVSKPDKMTPTDITSKVRSDAQTTANLIQTQDKDQGVI